MIEKTESVRIDRELLGRIKVIAEREDRSVKKCMERLIHKAMGHKT